MCGLNVIELLSFFFFWLFYILILETLLNFMTNMNLQILSKRNEHLPMFTSKLYEFRGVSHLRLTKLSNGKTSLASN